MKAEKKECRICFDCKQYKIAGPIWIKPWCDKTQENVWAKTVACGYFKGR